MRRFGTIWAFICALFVSALLWGGFCPVAQAHEIYFHCPQKVVKVGDTVRVEYGIGEMLFADPDPNWVDWLN